MEKDWNTKNLLQRLATDAFSAASAAVMVAPLITIIDKCVPPRHRILSPISPIPPNDEIAANNSI